MTEAEKIGLLANLERCQAQERIHLGLIDWTDYQGVYDLFLMAYGDEAKARRAQSIALERHVDSKIANAKASKG